MWWLPPFYNLFAYWLGKEIIIIPHLSHNENFPIVLTVSAHNINAVCDILATSGFLQEKIHWSMLYHMAKVDF